MIGKLMIAQLAELSDDTHDKSGRLAISDSNASEFVRRLVAWVEDVMREADEQARAALVRDF